MAYNKNGNSENMNNSSKKNSNGPTINKLNKAVKAVNKTAGKVKKTIQGVVSPTSINKNSNNENKIVRKGDIGSPT
jgi:hypothetical protein